MAHCIIELVFQNNRTKTKNGITFCKKLNLFIISFPPDKIPDNYYNIYGPLFFLSSATKEKKLEIFSQLTDEGRAEIFSYINIAMAYEENNLHDLISSIIFEITIAQLAAIFNIITNTDILICIMQQLSSIKKLELLGLLSEEQSCSNKESLIDAIINDEKIPDELKGASFGLLPKESQTYNLYDSLSTKVKKTAAKYLPPSQIPSKMPFYLTIGMEILLVAVAITGIALCCTGVGLVIGIQLIGGSILGGILTAPFVWGAHFISVEPANEIKKYKQEANTKEDFQTNEPAKKDFQTELKKFKEKQKKTDQQKTADTQKNEPKTQISAKDEPELSD